MKKRRPAIGENHGLSKLTEKDVRDIRSSDLAFRLIAEKYKISIAQIYNIKHFKAWKHIK